MKNLYRKIRTMYLKRVVFKKHGVKRGSIIKSWYGDTYRVTRVEYTGKNRFPMVYGVRDHSTNGYSSREVLVNPETRKGVVVYK